MTTEQAPAGRQQPQQRTAEPANEPTEQRATKTQAQKWLADPLDAHAWLLLSRSLLANAPALLMTAEVKSGGQIKSSATPITRGLGACDGKPALAPDS